MNAATPGQALSPDPADFAYHVRATAFNVLTGKMAGGEWHVPRSERDAIARAVVDAVEPLIRADERAVAAQEPHAAPGLRAALEATLADWRDDAVYRLTDTRDEMTEHHAVTGCADTLAAILADHPDAEPKAAPELAALREGITALASDLDASAKATSPSKKSNIEAEIAIALRKLLEGK